MNIRSRDSCREKFKKLQILPLQSQHILSLLLFVISGSDVDAKGHGMFEHASVRISLVHRAQLVSILTL